MYMFVKSSKKEAEKALRSLSPHMRQTDSTRKSVSAYFTDADRKVLYFIHEGEI